ncbi:MAG: sigma-54-dependent Fis family transcriptional regulator [Acidobacteria bacterium]|nr:sigma-54-dependent Fis family transcriptional regulator [Acidobacteriota bacterium]
MEQILIVDDDPGFRALLQTILKGEGYDVQTTGSIAAAIRAGAQQQFHIVLTDLKLPDGDGLAILRRWRENGWQTPFIVITGFGTVPSAVEAMKLGAVDYLGKPLSSPDELRILVQKALAGQRVANERDVLREENAARFSTGNIIAEHPSMVRTLALVRKVAATNATVLVTGESGTGKEILARLIHDNSTRADRVFVAVNCAALSPTLIESELFGHEKGAFTGAGGQHSGRFERAHGGTLFLDEIGELDANLQTKLLRVLQERTFERVGGARQITVDVRVVAATNRDLKSQVKDGAFRQDLYYRISAFPIEAPPLRERGSDIVKLARFFLGRAARDMGKPAPGLSTEAEAALMSYAWPGNVRELENMMERAAILADGEVALDDLAIADDAPSRPLRFTDIERKAIEDALADNGGNRTRAARQLGISLRTLQYRLKEYGLV